MATICRILGIGRATAHRSGKAQPRRYRRRDDPLVYAQLREVLRERGSYGYRRAGSDAGDLGTGPKVIAQLEDWMEDYNSFAPHSGLGDRSPSEYRREMVST